MKYFKGFNSGSLEHVQQDPRVSFTMEIQPLSLGVKIISPKKEQDSSDIRCSEYMFMYSGGVLPEKTTIIQETELFSEKWYGRVVEVENETIILDVRNEKQPQKRIKIRVKKDLVEGDLSRLNAMTNVVVCYTKVRNFQDAIEKRVLVRLHEPAEIPQGVLNNEIDAKMRRFSYMFLED